MCVYPLALFASVNKVAFVYIIVGKKEFSLTIGCIILPVSFKSATIWETYPPLPLFQPIDEITFINITVTKFLDSQAMLLTL